MRHRFFIDADLAAGNTLALSHDERHHARVLRVREGEEVEVFNGRGDSYLAKYESSDLIRLMQRTRSEEHTSELQSRLHLVCRLLLEKKKDMLVVLPVSGLERIL